MYYNNLISSRQLRVLLIMDIISIGIISLPQRAIAFSGADGWISLCMAAVFSVVYGFFVCFLCERAAGNSFVSLCRKTVGSFFGTVIGILFYIKLIIMGGLYLRVFSEIVKNNILDTSVLFIAFVFVLVCGYSATIDFEQRGRMAEIIVLFMLIPVIIVFAAGFANGDISNIKPVLTVNNLGVLRGGCYTSLFFFPLEFLLLSCDNIEGIKNIKRPVFTALIFSGLMLSFITLVLISRFGLADVKRQIFPTLEMIYSVELPGAFVERLEAVVITFLILGMFFIIHSFIFFSDKVLNNVINADANSFVLVFTCLLMFAVSMLPKDVIGCTEALNAVVKYGEVIFLVVLPVILSVIFYFGGKSLEEN